MSDITPRRKPFRPTADNNRKGQQHGSYVREPDSPEILERVRIELEKSRTDDFQDYPARYCPPQPIAPKPFRDQASSPSPTVVRPTA